MQNMKLPVCPTPAACVQIVEQFAQRASETGFAMGTFFAYARTNLYYDLAKAKKATDGKKFAMGTF